MHNNSEKNEQKQDTDRYPVFSLVEIFGLGYNRNAYGMKKTIQKFTVESAGS